MGKHPSLISPGVETKKLPPGGITTKSAWSRMTRLSSIPKKAGRFTAASSS